eukprot:7443048-Ditylum_brightwellii.AAC.1
MFVDTEQWGLSLRFESWSVYWLSRCESELALRKLLGLQNHLVVVSMNCPHAVRTTEAGM